MGAVRNGDKSDIGQVAKFSYLKELLVPRVRATIDGLPFTSEGYVRAKNIPKTKYERPSEVANAHIQSIMGLPVITGTNPARICEFYEKLVTNIQTLESMGKEKEIRGYVRLTLDKLPGHFKPSKEIGNPSPVFIVNQGNTY